MDENTLYIAGVPVARGERKTVELPIAKLYTHTGFAMPVHVVRGKREGEVLFVSAAVHGDELNGVEIIRRLLRSQALKRLRGTLIAIPIVNVYGFTNHSRYLPDRRDLNRSFPGSASGSLAARLAHIFMEQIVARCSYGIDIHTGALHRSNLPQIRANLDDPRTAELAKAFGVPVLINADTRDGSLREAAAELGIVSLLYEAGEALRFDEVSIRAGVRGVMNVMRVLAMLPGGRSGGSRLPAPVVARSTSWVRAPDSGIVRSLAKLGARVSRNQVLGIVSDSFGERETPVVNVADGIVIGLNNLPLCNEGDALYHIARFRGVTRAIDSIESFHETLRPDGNASEPT